MLTDAEDGLSYAKLMDVYCTQKAVLQDARLPTRIQMVPEPDRAAISVNKAKKGNLTELEVVQYGYQFFEKFKGLIVDMIFSRKERNMSRGFFLNRTAKDAFKVVEVELNFIYEVLFTKLPVVFGRIGAISRFFCLATICSGIVLFILQNKSNFSESDVTITYGLLFGALVQDMTALIMLLFSDWTIVTLRKSPDAELDKSLKTRIVTVLLRLMTEGTVRDTKDDVARPSRSESQYCKPFYKRRWSETISTYNLIYYCLHPRSKIWQFVYDKLGLSWFLDSIFYVKDEKFAIKLRDFIFNELKLKSELADDMETAKEISSARGDWVLRVEEGWSSLLKYVVDVEYDQSLILWHITTELCYNHELYYEQKRMDSENDYKDYREIAKLLSDYMLYLLIMQPSMMSAVAGIGQIRFRDTCAEAKRFFEDGKSFEPSNLQLQGAGGIEFDLKQINACMEILKVLTVVERVTVKGGQSKSLLFDSCILAKRLMEIEEDPELKKGSKWLIISKVWVELLCYGASHSRASTQAAQVSKGGELITIVWLLMTHFGLGDQFQINEGQPRAKLIVGK